MSPRDENKEVSEGKSISFNLQIKFRIGTEFKSNADSRLKDSSSQPAGGPQLSFCVEVLVSTVFLSID